MIVRLLRREVQNLGERMRGFERRDDALELGAKLKRRKRLRVRGGQVAARSGADGRGATGE